MSVIFKDSLRDDTTYTFNFGESIQDNNESNILSYFSYTLSLGPPLILFDLEELLRMLLKPKHPLMFPYNYTLLTARTTTQQFTPKSLYTFLVRLIAPFISFKI